MASIPGLKKVGSFWQYSIQVNGQRAHGSTKAMDLTTARRVLEEKRRALLHDQLNLNNKIPPTLNQVWEAWWKAHQTAFSQSYLVSAECRYRLWIKPELGVTRVDRIQTDAVSGVRVRQLEAGRSPRYANNTLELIRKALIRSQFDAFVRGVWFLEKATDEQIKEFAEKEFVKNVPPINYERLVDEIETVERYSGGTFSSLKDTINVLHDFTHGGKLAVSAYVTRGEIGANFLPEDVISCLRSSGTLGLLAANELSGMSGIEDLPAKVYQAHGDIYGDTHGCFTYDS